MEKDHLVDQEDPEMDAGAVEVGRQAEGPAPGPEDVKDLVNKGGDRRCLE